jgi:hypothetical protein
VVNPAPNFPRTPDNKPPFAAVLVNSPPISFKPAKNPGFARVLKIYIDVNAIDPKPVIVAVNFSPNVALLSNTVEITTPSSVNNAAVSIAKLPISVKVLAKLEASTSILTSI